MRPLALLVSLICAAPAFAAEPATHWSLRPRTRPTVPEVRDPKFAIRTPVDAFILDRLGKEGLSPAPEADRLTLVRRVTFDLTGLPPSPAEVDAFVNDKTPDAYEKLVERLLASPQRRKVGAAPLMWRFRDGGVRVRPTPLRGVAIPRLRGRLV